MSAPICQCDGFCKGRRYTCPGCLRFVPYCFGAADDLGHLCDNCWVVARVWLSPITRIFETRAP